MTKTMVTPAQLHDEALSLYKSGTAKNMNDAAEILLRNHLDFADNAALDDAAASAWKAYKTPSPAPKAEEISPTHPAPNLAAVLVNDAPAVVSITKTKVDHL